MKNFKLLIIVLVALITSCRQDDEPEPLVTADFEVNMTVEKNQAILSLNNTSQNATTYEWSFPNAIEESATEEHPTATYTKNGTYTITLVASNGDATDTKSLEITIDTLFEHIPYRYLENDGIFMYYETDNREVYQSLIPDEFDMPSRMVVFAFFNDFYKLDHGAIPYKENAISILVEYQGEEFFHVVYMPVTDEYSMRAGIVGLGLPKTMAAINFTRNSPTYYGDALNLLGGTMDMSVNTQDFTIENEAKQDMITLSLHRSIQIRNGNIIEIGKTGGNQTSVINIAEQFPNLVTLQFGEAIITTNTDAISFDHPLDLTPSKIIGGYYLKNKIPFGLTGNKF
jgi:PKD repeat protein